MTPNDADAFVRRLQETSAVYSTRPPSEAAITAWIAALRPYRIDDVLRAMEDWIARGTRAPVPADIVRRCDEFIAARAAVEDDTQRRVERDAPHYMGRTEGGQRALRELRALLRRGQKPPSRAWAGEILARYCAGHVGLRDDGPPFAPVTIALACTVNGDDPDAIAAVHRAAREQIDFDNRTGEECDEQQ